ncbi:MAG TPA: T9SS type A sorting domain-containing protein [Caldithrix sp.]|nr:T9SS type A sorting domain-containing protein [Caldithrix sp.]
MGTKPGDASDPSNLSADDSFFIAANAHDYHLAQNSPAIDAGIDILQVTNDFDGNPRFPGSYDAGAYEFGNSTGFIFDQGIIPGQIKLFHNYPNPFNPNTRIAVQLKKPLRIKLVIYNLLGQEIYRLAEGKFPAGNFEFGWNGKNAAGVDVVSGIYFYRLSSENFQQTRKMYLMR